MRDLVILAYLLLGGTALAAQLYFTEVHSVWDDRFAEWEISMSSEEEEEYEIFLSQLWPLKNNWEEWRIDGDDMDGTVKTKWRGDISQWELRMGDHLVLISQLSRGNPNRWEIREKDQRLTVRTSYYNQANEWHALGMKDRWAMFAEQVDDPRDWVVEDYLDREYSVPFRMSMVFISLWQSIPKG